MTLNESLANLLPFSEMAQSPLPESGPHSKATSVDKSFAREILFKTQIANKFSSRRSKASMETAQEPSCGLDDCESWQS